MGRPIGFATLIVIAVFTPLFATGGIEGKMYSPLAAAVVVGDRRGTGIGAYRCSGGLRFAFYGLSPSDTKKTCGSFARLKKVYAPTLDAAMRHAGLVRIGALVVTIPALVLAFYVGSDFMPKLDEGAFLIQTVLATRSLPR